ncbi:MAG: glycosyl transferase [Modestobacter sp.]|nr:glycosyl transferase [Modestobacter sp.]
MPSGGNVYDRRIRPGLPAAGWSVHEFAVIGAWPRPDRDGRASLARTLAALPDGAMVLIDGLVARGVPDVVIPEARRLELVLLVHLPLDDEVGQAPVSAAELAALERRTLPSARAVVATSPWSAHRLVARHRLGADRVHVATPGVDPAPLAPGTDGVTGLLCVGAVVTEALARGIPVLAAAVGGCRRPSAGIRTAGCPGIVTPPADITAFAAALRRWFGEPVLREELRHAARARRDRLNGWEATCRCLTPVLDRLRGTPG